jgi:Carboxypeptidase regulatory-like domain
MNSGLFVNRALVLAATISLHVASSAKALSIAGHAVDGAGYPIPGVSVTAMPEAGGIATRTRTGADGVYQFGSLPDDAYRVDFEILGFDLIRRNHVRVRQDATAYVDATLSISGACECIAVTDATELREGTGQVVDESGRPLAHARLEIASPLRRDVGYADGEGRFRVRVPVTESWPLTASDSGFGSVKLQVSGTADVPIVLTLTRVGTTGLPDTERLKRTCRCAGDLFTHDGR